MTWSPGKSTTTLSRVDRPPQELSFADQDRNNSMIRIQGSYVGNRQDTAEAIDFFRRGLINAPYKVVGLSELPHVFELMEQGKIAGRYVCDVSR